MNTTAFVISLLFGGSYLVEAFIEIRSGASVGLPDIVIIIACVLFVSGGYMALKRKEKALKVLALSMGTFILGYLLIPEGSVRLGGIDESFAGGEAVLVVITMIIVYSNKIRFNEFEKYVKPLEKKRNDFGLKKVFSEYETCFKEIEGKSFAIEGTFIEINIVYDEELRNSAEYRKILNLMAPFNETELMKALGGCINNFRCLDDPILRNYAYLLVSAEHDYAVFGLIELPQQKETLLHLRPGDKVRISGILRYWDFENKGIWLKIHNIRKIG